MTAQLCITDTDAGLSDRPSFSLRDCQIKVCGVFVAGKSSFLVASEKDPEFILDALFDCLPLIEYGWEQDTALIRDIGLRYGLQYWKVSRA